jgi:hypothetical protein
LLRVRLKTLAAFAVRDWVAEGCPVRVSSPTTMCAGLQVRPAGLNILLAQHAQSEAGSRDCRIAVAALVSRMPSMKRRQMPKMRKRCPGEAAG